MQQSRRIRRLSMSTTVVTAGTFGLIYAGQLTAPANAAIPSMIVSGTVYSATGAPDAGMPLQLNAVDNSLTVLPDGTLPLLTTVTDGSGNFSIDTTGCCTALDATLTALSASHNGDIELELWGPSGDGGIVLNDFPVKLTNVEPSTPVLTPETGTKTISGIKLQSGRGLV